MKELRRSPDFYLGWMLGDGAGRRKGVAEELEAALKLGLYNINAGFVIMNMTVQLNTCSAQPA